ncbi:MAG: serine/threonine protein kinase [Kiritimatiellaeota bacterium]|nr:serine/threonine protein kinase [Kiritimatiellota bacterium]
MRERLEVKYVFTGIREIARGGMGSVYEALQLGTGGFSKRVAVKTLLPRLSEDRRFVAMFMDEARLVADLVHENIVQIYQLERNRDGYFIVMEFVQGVSLHDFIEFHRVTGENIPEELAVFIASRIARGLAYAHSRADAEGNPLNIVHRDVCPTNILITTEGLPKLTDFGIAKAATNAMQLHDRHLVGKFPYMAPEQARGQPVDFRADIYSLGLVLYEMLVKHPARHGSTRTALLQAARTGEIDWAALPEQTGPALVSILEHTLQSDRALRYGDTAELAHDLEYYIYHKGYGPTVVTLEHYLRKQMPGLYVRERSHGKLTWVTRGAVSTVALPAPDASPQEVRPAAPSPAGADSGSAGGDIPDSAQSC